MVAARSSLVIFKPPSHVPHQTADVKNVPEISSAPQEKFSTKHEQLMNEVRHSVAENYNDCTSAFVVTEQT